MSDASLSSSPQNLALTLRSLIKVRGLKRKALAAQVGLTESSLSMILNAKARPRQLTLTRLLNHLNCTFEEEQTVISAYDQTEGADLPLRPGLREKPISQDELDRVRRYMKLKAACTGFEEQVEPILIGLGIPFERNFRPGDLICDFFIHGPPRIAMECKYNIHQDLDRTLAAVNLLQEELKCIEVIVVFPEDTEADPLAKGEIEVSGYDFVSLDNFKNRLVQTIN